MVRVTIQSIHAFASFYEPLASECSTRLISRVTRVDGSSIITHFSREHEVSGEHFKLSRVLLTDAFESISGIINEGFTEIPVGGVTHAWMVG